MQLFLRLNRFKVPVLMIVMALTANGWAFSLLGSPFKTITPKNESLAIPMETINDGKAHYFKARAKDGTWVYFFVVRSRDGVMRAAVDACDVCYRAGRGYSQEGDEMVCENCGMRFSTRRINEVKGGCNPAPLERIVQNQHLVITMDDINKNAWYCKYRKNN